ncbi:DNA translocase FtsK [Alkalihalobacillus sp. TS-13]|uniref:DNA translocase FtsK n=1 Tax=Alkalihalobacillus sp. TS-13 TaxID=2842455 RepID=UPI001C88DA6A|nr:DNA translocase FtsK [Alkalihalobacillus sp. TS-13]
MSNWLKKMMNLIFEDEDIETEKENNRTIPKANTQQKRKGMSVGRMTAGKSSFEPRMVHQYPKEGSFRFPVIPDDKNEKDHLNDPTENERATSEYEPQKQTKQADKKQPRVERRQSERNRSGGRSKSTEEKPKFTGENFTPTEIPSPIYGFGSRPEVFPPKIGPESAGTISSKKQAQQSKYEPGYEAYQAISEMKEEEVLYQSEMKESEFSNQNELDKSESEKEEWTLHGWGFTQELKQEREEPITPTWNIETGEDHQEVGTEDTEIPLNLESESTEIQPEETLEDSSTDTKQVIAENAEPSTHTYENNTPKTSETVETNKVENDEPEPEKPTQSVSLKNEEEKKKSPIPFNVMMLQRDRKPQRKTQADHSSTPKHEKSIERGYSFPSERLLDREIQEINDDETWLNDQIELLQSTLHNFNVKATVVGATKGPSVTRIEVQPAPGVKVNKITNLSDDIKLSLAAKDIRMEAPIPGRNAIGIEVPNKVSKSVTLREIITHPNFTQSSSPLSVALGLDISGNPVVTDLQKMPHGLIAGATGSGKSVCINSLLISILYKAHPDDVRLMLIDPKMVELAPYNQLPHLVTPVITDAKEATLGLKWAVDEMERRYELFAKTGVRDMERFNKLVKEKGEPDQKLPYVVVVIDELADLMMVSPQEVEDSICRIAQKARACGIHLLLATQRPSVDVITGLIKANIPTRVAFSVSSSVDSRTIIDTNGADKLLGKGDMLFLGNGVSKPVRVQGNFVSDEEIERITQHVKEQRDPDYLFEKEELVQNTLAIDQNDELFDEACDFVLEQGAASSSALQRRFRIGYNRAARLVDMMETRGIVSEAMGSKPRNVLVSKQEFYDQVSEE